MTPSSPRVGICVCGRPLAAHFDRRNAFVACAQLAEAEQGVEAARSCTTLVAAQAALDRRVGDGLVERVR